MPSSDQQHLMDALEQQQHIQQRVDRVFKIVLPIMAFLLTVICANLNVWSTVCTLVALVISFWMVGIKRQSLMLWVTVLLVYCLVDNLLSYGNFNVSGFSRQFGTSMIFLGIIGIGRPYIERWFVKKAP